MSKCYFLINFIKGSFENNIWYFMSCIVCNDFCFISRNYVIFMNIFQKAVSRRCTISAFIDRLLAFAEISIFSLLRREVWSLVVDLLCSCSSPNIELLAMIEVCLTVCLTSMTHGVTIILPHGGAKEIWNAKSKRDVSTTSSFSGRCEVSYWKKWRKRMPKVQYRDYLSAEESVWTHWWEE